MAEQLKAGQDPLSWVTMIPIPTAHISVKREETCVKCKLRPCTYICPSQVYVWRDLITQLEVRYQRCIECGACVIACPKNIEMKWPENGAGVQYGSRC